MRLYLLLALAVAATSALPSVTNLRNVTYNGFRRNTLDVFLNIRFGEDTSGQNRFKPPRPHTPNVNSTIDATSLGPACPQPPNSNSLPIVLTNITYTSEDCLNLNIVRPNDTTAGSKLPVMVYIHGGSFWTGSNHEITTTPDGMILESIENKLPVMHVALQYRLGGKTV